MSDLNLNSLYQQLILEHYRKPRNKGELPEKTVEIHMANPVCGDEIRLQLQVEEDRIVDARHVGQGCSISQAAVSMMTNLLKDKELAEAEGLAQRFTSMMHGDEEVARDSKVEHRDIAHPISQEFRDYLQSEILKAYQAEIQKTA